MKNELKDALNMAFGGEMLVTAMHMLIPHLVTITISLQIERSIWGRRLEYGTLAIAMLITALMVWIRDYDKSMVAAGTVFALILCDLFGSVPTHMRVLSQIRYLTPIYVLLNSNVPDMRLTKLFGTYLISFQTGSLLYLLCGLLLVIVIVRIFRRRYCWKNDSGS